MSTILNILGILAVAIGVIACLSVIILSYLLMVDEDAQRKAIELGIAENPFQEK